MYSLSSISVYIILYAFVLTISVRLDRDIMGTKEKVAEELKNPSGGDEETTDEEWQGLRDKLTNVNVRQRRRTMDLMTSFLEGKEPQWMQQPQQQPQQQVLQVQHGLEQRTLTVEPSTRKLRNFSGADKLGNGEIDFKHWKRAALRIKEDREISEAHKKRIVLQSLQGKAEDAVDLHRDQDVDVILQMLDKMFGSVADGSDLLADYYQMFQQENQLASEYLSSLFVHLSEVIKCDTLTMSELPKAILQQFVRGISDEELLNKLRLEEKIASPPNFPDLLAAVRREESRRTERRLRHRKNAKARASTVVEQSSADVNNGKQVQQVETVKSVEVVQLQQRVKELEQQVGDMSQGRKGVKRGFCYRCGQDGHFASECDNKANRSLVEKKAKARRERLNQGKNY